MAYRHPIISRATFTPNSRWCNTCVAQWCHELFAFDFCQVGNVDIVIMVLVMHAQVRRYTEGLKLKMSHTPCVEEKGIRAAFSGATISSISVVAFSRNVSGAIVSKFVIMYSKKRSFTLSCDEITVEDASAMIGVN
jgi:hypothetical protein